MKEQKAITLAELRLIQCQRWWRDGQVYYNAILFVVGLASLCAWWADLRGAMPAGAIVPYALVYGLLANVCYASGFLVCRRSALRSTEWVPLAQLTYGVGLAFSVAITGLTPVLIVRALTPP